MSLEFSFLGNGTKGGEKMDEIIDKIGARDITHPFSYSLVEQIYAQPTDMTIAM